MKATRPVLLVVAAMFCFALMAVFTRNAEASVLAVSAWRAVLVAVVFGLWTAVSAGPSAMVPKGDTLKLGVWYGLALALASSTFVGGYAFTTVANTIFLHNLAPAMALPLAWWAFQEKPNAAMVTGAGLAVVGVGMLSGVTLFHAAHFTSPDYLLGDFLAFLSAVGYAAVLVLTKATRRAETPIVPTLFTAWCVAAAVLVLVALVGGSLSMSGSAFVWTAGLAVISTVIPFYLLNLGMRHVTAGQAAILSLAEVIFATLLGIALFGESLAPIGWVGGVLVLLGVVYPFVPESGPVAERGAPFPPGGLGVRTARTLLALGLVNGAAILAIVQGSDAAALLAWLAMVQLLRLGLAPLAEALDHRGGPAIRWGAAAVGLALAMGIVFRNRDGDDQGLWLVLAMGALWVAADRWLAGKQAESHRDPLLLGHTAVACVVLGTAAALVAHPGGRWLMAAGGALAGVQALFLSLAAMRRHPITAARPDLAGLLAADERLPAVLRPAVVAPVLVGIFFAGGLHAVPAGHRGIVSRFGQPIAALEPGLAVRLPPPIETLDAVHTDLVHRVDLLESGVPLLAGDQSLISMQAVTHYRAADPIAFWSSAADHDSVVSRASRAAIVRSIGGRPIDEALTDGRQALAAQAREQVQATLDAMGLGIDIVAVELTTTAVPPQVTEAFLDVISASEERESTIDIANAYAAQVLPEAAGEAKARVENAHGEAARIRARGEADHTRVEALSTARDRHAPTVDAWLRTEATKRALSDKRLILNLGETPLWLDRNQTSAVPQREGSDDQ